MKIPLAIRLFEGWDLEGNFKFGPEILGTEFQCYGTEYPKLLGGGCVIPFTPMMCAPTCGNALSMLLLCLGLL